MRLPEPVKRYADRVDAMSLRERVLIFLAVAVVLVAFVDSALLEPILKRQKANSQRIQQQQDEIRAMQAQVQAYAQARSGDGASGKRQRFDKGGSELAALDREIAEKQRGLVTPERMAKMLSEIVRRDPDIELVSLRTLAATGLASAWGSALSGIYRHGIEVAVAGSYFKTLNYVSQLERLPAKIFWGNMELQAGAYPKVTLKITLYTLSPEKTWLSI
jgi:MSHA biogenesis protein MshJ